MAKRKNKAFDRSKYQFWIDPQDVTEYERNAKVHTEKQIHNIANSIKRFGWQQDCVLTADKVLVIGHGRRLAAIELGCEMPYHVIDKTVDEITDEDIRELRIADNQTNAETGFDFSVLDLELDGLDFDGFEFDFMDGDPDEYEPEDDEVYTTKTDIPQYEPDGAQPDLSELVDETKYNELLERIEASELSEKEKDF